MSVLLKGWLSMDNKTLERIAKALERLIKLVEDDIKGVHRKKRI